MSSILFTAYSAADLLGKTVFLALFLLSGTTWFILLHKVWLFRHVRKEANKLQAMIQREETGVLQLNPDSMNPFTHIYLTIKTKTVEILDKNRFFANRQNVFLSDADVDFISTHASISITKEWKTLEKNLYFLSTAVTLAPFLGILGTVWGVLVSFSELHKGSGHYSNAIVLSGLSTALATTVLGLIIAIPALIAHSYLKNSLKGMTSEMQDFRDLLLTEIELQYRKVEE